MTPTDLSRLVEDYRAGVDAELLLLRQLSDIASRQRSTTGQGDYAAFGHAADERDRLMQGLVSIEQDLRGVRTLVAQYRERLLNVPGFEVVESLRREAAMLVSTILASDRQSLTAMADAELARRSAVASLERGESTLAAYRRVLAPPAASATLLDRRG